MSQITLRLGKKNYALNLDELSVNLVQGINTITTPDGIVHTLSQSQITRILKESGVPISRAGKREAKESKKAKKERKEKITEQKLDAPDVVEGPVSVSLHEGHGKRIYVFGDWHGRRTKPCDEEIKSARKYLRFEQYLDESLKANKSLLVDLVLEAEYFGEGEESKTIGYIQDIVTHYAPCARGRRCPEHPNLRVHLVDLRPTYALEILHAGDAARALLGNGGSAFSNAWEHIAALYDVIPEAKKAKADTAIFLKLHQDLANGELNKQLAFLKDSEVAVYALTHFAQQPVNYVTIAEILIAAAKSTQEGEEEEIKERKITGATREGLGELVKFADNLNNLMEQYTLVTLFRSWDDRPPIENAIVFEGDFHANRLRAALKAIGMPSKIFVTQIEKAKGHLPTLQYLNLTVLPFPLFRG